MARASSRTGSAGIIASATLLLAAAVAGCQTAGPAAGTTPTAPPPTAVDAANRYKVTTASASFYRYGPSQPGGPDLGIKQDTRVTLTKRSFGYSQIKLADGTAGFIGTEDITPLTADEIAAETLPVLPAPGMNVVANRVVKPGAATNAAHRRSRPGPSLPISPGDEPPLPAAPEPALPSGEVPGFRY